MKTTLKSRLLLESLLQSVFQTLLIALGFWILLNFYLYCSLSDLALQFFVYTSAYTTRLYLFKQCLCFLYFLYPWHLTEVPKCNECLHPVNGSILQSLLYKQKDDMWMKLHCCSLSPSALTPSVHLNYVFTVLTKSRLGMFKSIFSCKMQGYGFWRYELLMLKSMSSQWSSTQEDKRLVARVYGLTIFSIWGKPFNVIHFFLLAMLPFCKMLTETPIFQIW